MVAADLVFVDSDNGTIGLTRAGRELAVDLWGVGVADIEAEREKMLEEGRNTDLAGVWSETYAVTG
jgi:hypothetical protein